MKSETDDMPVSITSNTLTLLGVEVEMHVLSNGLRVLGADSFYRLVKALSESDHPPDELEDVARALRGLPLREVKRDGTSQPKNEP